MATSDRIDFRYSFSEDGPRYEALWRVLGRAVRITIQAGATPFARSEVFGAGMHWNEVWTLTEPEMAIRRTTTHKGQEMPIIAPGSTSVGKDEEALFQADENTLLARTYTILATLAS